MVRLLKIIIRPIPVYGVREWAPTLVQDQIILENIRERFAKPTTSCGALYLNEPEQLGLDRMKRYRIKGTRSSPLGYLALSVSIPSVHSKHYRELDGI